MKRFLVGFMICLAGSAFAAGEVMEKLFRATVGSDGVQRVEVMGGGYYFAPNHIIVRVHVPVELVVRKEAGIVPHNITAASPAAGIVFDESLESEPKTIRFTPSRTGTFPFYCSKKLLFLESHRDKGMEGVIEVVE